MSKQPSSPDRDPATAVGVDPKTTEVGSVFVSNYPPYSFWSGDELGAAAQAIEQPPQPDVPLGLYVHVPFCRKRCKFCYFRVFVDKNGAEVQRYLDAVGREIAGYSARPIVGGRPLRFVYFGGGTPSFISSRHLRTLFGQLRDAFSWDEIQEVTFECEPGTLTQSKLETIREIGVTRLSLGIENFDDRILQENGRAHVSREIFRVLPWIRSLDFDQLNVDLIAGMVGESWDSWKETVRRTIEVAPDSVTLYQMELPFNTVYSKSVLDGGSVGVADWDTKRAWHDYGFEQLEQAGYDISSGYTMVRRGRNVRFVYRNSVWQGCDLLSVGISSFGHLNGVHYQNEAGWGSYLDRVEAGELPLMRAYVPSDEERLTREWILQLKLGRVPVAAFAEKFGVDVTEVFREPLARLASRGMLELNEGEVRLTRQGLLRVDSLLPEFYAQKYQNARYT